MCSRHKLYSLALLLFCLDFGQLEAGVKDTHAISSPVKERPQQDKSDSPLSPELTEKFENQISRWSKDDDLDSATVSAFFDDLANDLSEDQQRELFSGLLEKYPESSINAPWRRQVEARLKPLDELIHGLGTNEEGDVPAVRKADQIELQRRIETELGVDTETARRLGLIVGSGGAHPFKVPSGTTLVSKSAAEKLRVGLGQAFKTEELKSLEQALLRVTPKEPGLRDLRENLVGGLELIRVKGHAPSPAVSPGNALQEPRNGNFLGESRTTLGNGTVIGHIIDYGGQITLVGPEPPGRDFGPGEKGVRLVPSPSRGPWVTDSKGLPVTGPEGKPYLVDAKYHGPPVDDTLPQVEGEVSKLPVRPFGAHVEGGNVMVVPGDRTGKPVVITSDGYVKTNASIEGTYPEFAEKLFRKQFASDGRSVLQISMPQDGTRHVDMNISQPDQEIPTVFVSTYLDRHIDLLNPSDQRHAQASRSILNEAEKKLRPYVDVIRVPQAPPVTMKKGANPTHFSRLNALYFTNPEGEKVAIVPDYREYPHLDVNTEIINANRKALEKMGYQKVIITPSYSAQQRGSFHCMFPQICY